MRWLNLRKLFADRIYTFIVVAVLFAVSFGTAIKIHHRHPLLVKPQATAFYFWKTKWRATPEMTSELAKSGVGRLYIRFFDVGWDNSSAKAIPVSPIEFAAPLPTSPEIVPVVYVTNAVFSNMPYKDVEPLADNVWNKVSAMASTQSVALHELQIDCDWTDTSRKNYFHFVDLLRRRLNKERINVSSTIRLHQIKYAERTGVPPVNSGMLMFYNFGQIKADGLNNSIFNVKEAKCYASYIPTYELPLGISLPMFSWVVHVRDGKVQGLIEGIDPAEFEAQAGFKKVGEKQLVANDSFFFRGRYFIVGDKLNIESTNMASTAEAADLAIENANVLKGYSTVALFDLDERTSKSYGSSGIKEIFSKFE